MDEFILKTICKLQCRQIKAKDCPISVFVWDERKKAFIFINEIDYISSKLIHLISEIEITPKGIRSIRIETNPQKKIWVVNEYNIDNTNFYFT